MAVRWNLYIAAILSCTIYSFPLGYQTDIINNPQDLISKFMVDALNHRYDTTITADQESALWAAIVALYPVGQFIGGLLVPSLANRIGRKPTLAYVSNPIGVVGGLLLLLAKHYRLPEFLFAGRFIEGIRSGICIAGLNIYLMESAPDDVRGAVGCMMDFTACLGVFTSFFLSMPHIIGTDAGWPWLISLDMWFSLFGLITSIYLPESPKYLLGRRKYEKAEKAVAFFHGPETNVQNQLRKYRLEDSVLQESISLEIARRRLEKTSSFRKHLRIFTVSLVAGLAAVVSGYLTFGAYSTPILVNAGIPKSTATIYGTIMGATEILGGIASMICNHYAPRRLVLLSAMFLTLIYDVILSVCLSLGSIYRDTSYGYVLLHVGAISQMLLATVTTIGPLPLGDIIPPELAPLQIRAHAVSLSTCGRSIGNIITVFAVWPVYLKTGAWCFMMFAILTLTSLLYLWRYLDETSPRFAERRGAKDDIPSASPVGMYRVYGTFGNRTSSEELELSSECVLLKHNSDHDN